MKLCAAEWDCEIRPEESTPANPLTAAHIKHRMLNSHSISSGHKRSYHFGHKSFLSQVKRNLPVQKAPFNLFQGVVDFLHSSQTYLFSRWSNSGLTLEIRMCWNSCDNHTTDVFFKGFLNKYKCKNWILSVFYLFIQFLRFKWDFSWFLHWNL